MPPWVREYLGLPYRHGADGPREHDCRTLVRRVLRERFGVEAPSLDAPAPPEGDIPARARLLVAGAAEWVPVARRGGLSAPLLPRGQERPGDVALLRVGMYPAHLGIVVAPGWLLHTDAGDIGPGIGARVEEIWRGVLAPRVIGIYRHASLA